MIWTMGASVIIIMIIVVTMSGVSFTRVIA